MLNIKKIFYRSIENKEISYKELSEMIKKKKCILVDVRSSQEYEEGHLNGAINIPIYHIKQKIKQIIESTDSLIILYCSSGDRSNQAKAILESLGYDNVYTLKGGIDKIWIR